MAVYSISDLEKLSGIKAHTIRAWENRYGILDPKRTASNIRYYEDEDLKTLLNVALLNRNGHKISKIAKMSEETLAQHIAELSTVNYEYDTQLDALTISMIEMDDFKFSHILEANIKQIGFEATMLEVIYPFLDKLAALWLTGSVNAAQESFISNVLRAKLIAAIDRLPIPSVGSQRPFLLFLPEGEQQELSLLFMHYLLRSRGIRSVYLGQDISLADLKDVERLAKPRVLFTIISESFVRQPVEQYLTSLLTHLKDCEVWATGYQIAVQSVKPHERLQLLRSLGETVELIEKRSAGPSPVDETAKIR